MRRWGAIALAIILNSIGHSMTIVTNMGSMPWPASIVNIMHTLHWTMYQTIFCEGLVVIILNLIWTSGWSWTYLAKQLGFLTPYSILMQCFADCWRWFGIDRLAIPVRFCFDLVGLMSAFIGFTIYQNVDFRHPQDELSITMKHHFNVRFMQSFNMFLPILIVVLCAFHNHAVFAVNVGTVIGFLLQGRFVNFCDDVWERLTK